MKFALKAQLIMVLSLCAALSLWRPEPNLQTDPALRVDGVYLGMTRSNCESLPYEPRYAHAEVQYNDAGLVAKVSGCTLELEGVDLTPDFNDESTADKLEEILGDPDWVSPEGFSWSHSSRYDRPHLTVDYGCSGYYFILGEDERASHFIPYSSVRNRAEN